MELLNTDYGSFPHQALTLEAIGRSGYYSIGFRPHGYWSTETIYLTIRRNFGHNWEVSLSHSSGGRLATPDSERYPPEKGYVAVASDLEAEANFGKSLIYLAEIGKTLTQYIPQLEEFHREKVEEYRTQREMEQAAKAALVEGDTPLTGTQAAQLIKDAKAQALGHKLVEIALYPRGGEHFDILERTSSTWRYKGTRLHRDKILPLLLTMSHRSCIK